MKKFPNFPEKLTSLQNLRKNGFAGILKSYPLILWQLIKISVLFHKSKHHTLPIWLKRIFGKFLNFPEKLTLCAKFEEKWFCWDFEVLPPNFVTINQNFSPIPQIYTPSTTILTWKNFYKVSQFSRKTYIVCKIWTKMVLIRIWSVTPWLSDSQSKFQSYSTNLHLQHYHSDNKEFLENFPIFQKNLHCLPNRYKIDSEFHIQFHIQFHIRRLNVLQDYLLLFGNFTPIPQIRTHRATNLAKDIFEEISEFSRKAYIVRKIWQKMVLLGFWSLTPWFCDN